MRRCATAFRTHTTSAPKRSASRPPMFFGTGTASVLPRHICSRPCCEPSASPWGSAISDYCNPGRTCLHGFNAVWLGELRRWHRLDARGNKPGIAAEFDLACERLAYPVRATLGEHDYTEIYVEPPSCVVT